MTENELSRDVIGVAIDIHKILGPGLLERAYEECLVYKLRQAGLHVEQQKPMPLVFEDVHLECGYRLDILVENKLVIEVKSVEALHDLFCSDVDVYETR